MTLERPLNGWPAARPGYVPRDTLGREGPASRGTRVDLALSGAHLRCMSRARPKFGRRAAESDRAAGYFETRVLPFVLQCSIWRHPEVEKRPVLLATWIVHCSIVSSNEVSVPSHPRASPLDAPNRGCQRTPAARLTWRLRLQIAFGEAGVAPAFETSRFTGSLKSWRNGSGAAKAALAFCPAVTGRAAGFN